VINLSRREALVGAAALVLGFYLPGCGSAAPSTVDGTLELGAVPSGADVDVTAWVRIAANGVVTLRVGASEMGQGVFTSLPMLLAEELDCAWDQVRAETAPAHEDYRRNSEISWGKTQMTVASETIKGYSPILREAGATARAMLVAAAAAKWGVDPGSCTTKAGVVTSGTNTATYGELAADAARQPVPGKVTLKDPASFTLIGTSPPRLDLPSKVDGSAEFGIDVTRPGMVVATPLRCPHVGGTLASVDDSAARAVNGVLDVLRIDDDTLVVVADSFWHAKKGREALVPTWDAGPNAELDSASISATLLAALDGSMIGVVSGSGVETPDVEATYEVPYLEHAPLEPLCCTVELTADRCDLWVGTQAQQPSQALAADLTGLSIDQVFVHTTFLGGGFGRRSETDFVGVAVKVAQALGKPVKVLWTREEMFAHGFRRPAFACRIRAKLDAGKVVGWDTALAGQNILARLIPGLIANHTASGSILAHEGLSDMPYAVGDQRVQYGLVDLPIPVGFWRSVHGSHNGFFRESFVDEVAHAAGRDPVDLRRELLADQPRVLAVLEKAVAEAGPVEPGRSRGVAVFDSFGSICAEVADLTVTDGVIKVHAVTAAIDCGLVIHPDTVKAQVMGALGMGLGAALHEELTIANGAAVPKNFDGYRVLTMAEMPRVTVHVIESTEPSGGVGEPGVPPIAAAVCNAVFLATGKRIRKLPIAAQLQA
jgi:isoquinoline 1-oxidoreductase beta subunit